MQHFIGKAARLLFLFAMLWSVGAGIWILMTPQTIHEIQAVASDDESQEATETTRQISFYNAQGAWGVFILIVFTSLYGLAGFFFLRSMRLPGAIFTVLALVLTYLAGLSIGPYYLPAAAALLAGSLFWFWSRFRTA